MKIGSQGFLNAEGTDLIIKVRKSIFINFDVRCIPDIILVCQYLTNIRQAFPVAVSAEFKRMAPDIEELCVSGGVILGRYIQYKAYT